MSTALATPTAGPPSLLAKMASRYSVEPSKMLATLKATAFKGDVSNEQLMALLIVADQYHLNPWTKEIYAFPDKGGIVPVIGVDGWSRIINEHPQFDGVTFDYDAQENSCTCVIYRKDRQHPIEVTEYLSECKRETQPWKSHPRRMLRHKALVQAARLAFGFAGVYDPDEAERIIEHDITPANGDAPHDPLPVGRVEQIKDRVRKAKGLPAEEQPPIDAESGETQAPTYTYAQVRDTLEKAKDADAVALAMDSIRFVADELQRVELRELAETLYK